MGTPFGRFELVRRLALGGMGEVHLAQSDGEGGLPTTLVLKRLLPHLEGDKAFLDLFLDEARIAARLVHPNVARLYELGQVDGRWYLAMEYVPGFDLREALDRAQSARLPLPVPLAVHIAAQAARGLWHAHQATDEQGRPLNVVHRDVSPQNLLLGFSGEVKVIDFGIARAARRSKAVEEEVLRGKYPYMSPEQVEGDEVDHRSDQFSLGGVLWEMLTGRGPFTAASPAQAIELVQRCAVGPPSTLAPGLPPGLDEAVLRSLEKNPGRRFADLGGFLHALEAVLAASPGQRPGTELEGWMQRVFPHAARVPDPAASPRPPLTASGRIALRGPAELGTLFKALSPAEQSALSQLSVFPYDFSVEAAEAVVDLSASTGAPFVLDLLEALRNLGLVVGAPPAVGTGELRFVLPAEVRRFAGQQLSAASAELRDGAVARHRQLR